jgi:hypothetical protein
MIVRAEPDFEGRRHQPDRSPGNEVRAHRSLSSLNGRDEQHFHGRLYIHSPGGRGWEKWDAAHRLGLGLVG